MGTQIYSFNKGTANVQVSVIVKEVSIIKNLVLETEQQKRYPEGKALPIKESVL